MSTGATYDVAVIGLGGMGSSTAYHLARRGVRVLGLEQFGPAHDQGSSHGQSRIIRLAYAEGAAYVPLLRRAYALWAELEAESGQHLLTTTGGLYLGPAESSLVAGVLASANAHDVEHEVLPAVEVKRRFPPFRPPEHFTGVLEPRAGVLDPEGSVRAALAQAQRHGAELHFEEAVLNLKLGPGDSGATIVTGRGEYTVGRVVLACGPWSSRFLPELQLPLTVLRLVMYWFAPTERPEDFLPDRCPIYIWELDDGLQFYGFPAMEGAAGGVKVAIHSQAGTPTAPEIIDRTVQEAEVERVRALLAEYVPQLAGRNLDARTCMYTMTPDEHFILDVHPAYPQMAIAAGFSGHGFKFCSVVGEIMADLVEHGTARHNIDLFSIKREELHQ